MNLFEYAVIFKGNEEDDPQLVVQITPLLAKDEKDVRAYGARAIPNEWADRIGELDILVRPFCCC